MSEHLPEEVRILHLDDNPMDAALIAEILQDEPEQFRASVTYVQNRAEFIAALQQKKFDVILSDFRMPSFDGDQALLVAKECSPDIPFIMVTGELGEERAIETLQRGATDYVIKDRLFRLIPAIRRALNEADNRRKRKEAEDALHRAHHATSEILESIQDAFFALDGQLRFTYVNREAEKLWNRSRGELVGQGLTEAFPLAAGTPFHMMLCRAMSQRQAVHEEVFSLVLKQWIDAVAYPTDTMGLSVYIRNITERKNVEDRLVMLSRAVEQSPASIMITDFSGTIEYVNEKFIRLTGYRREEVIGQNPRILKSGERPREEYAGMWKTLLAGGEWRGEFHNKKKNGDLFWEYASISAIKDKDGNVRHFLAIKEDITARKKGEEEIRRLNEELEERVQGRTEELRRANHELESFSYSVSHDLKAPLRLISGFADLLRQDGSGNLSEKQRQHLELILKNTEHMNQLINSLLVFSRIARQVPQLVPVDVEALARLVVEQQRQDAGSHVPIVEIGFLPPVTADPVLLRQVFANLIGNAFKFTRTTRDAHIEIGGEVKGNEKLYFVRDNGVGFPSSKKERLFQVFHRLHNQSEFEGTGIGLANVRKIVERHGGRVWAEGDEGRGASFFFTLPGEPTPGIEVPSV
jgi:PAS domain S-box-containing protein